MLSNKIIGATAAKESLYVDDVASVYLYTGNGSTQTITNNVDLSGEGGLVWIKSRSAATDHQLFDTARGATKELISNSTAAEATDADTLTAFNADGFSLGADSNTNTNAATYASFTFREAPKFFDVVTYTGTGSARTVAHNLGSVPGMIIVKALDLSAGWAVYHRGINGGTTPQNFFMRLDNTMAQAANSSIWGDTAPTSTNFTVGGGANINNQNGISYVAYLFAHDAGGFGESGEDSIISCGSFLSSATGSVTLGWEPQWILVKNRTAPVAEYGWMMFDVSRGSPVSGNCQRLFANLSDGEDASNSPMRPTATGFTYNFGNTGVGESWIYMAIRRPMKPPTSGTEVFSPNTSSSTQGTKVTTNFAIDAQLMAYRPGDGGNTTFADRLRGVSTTSTGSGARLISSSTAVESTATAITQFWDNTGFQIPENYSSASNIYWNFRRATGFFDVVCYTGTGTTNRALSHNLGVRHELVIVKCRSSGTDGGSSQPAVWWTAVRGSDGTGYWGMKLNETTASSFQDVWADNFPSTTTFNPYGVSLFNATEPAGNASGKTYVAYLFASVAGVSKVGSYTGNGSSQTINCGFTAGARFVMVKATSTTGDWVIVDTARGLVSGNDPFLELNTTAAEQTGQDILDPDSSGFVVNQTTESINASGVSYIFLAIA